MFGALTPFFIGFAIAYILNPLVEKLIKLTKMKRGLAIASVYFGIILLVSIFINMIVPSIIEGSVQIANEIPSQVTKFSTQINALDLENPQIKQYVMDMILSIQGKLTGWANLILTNITGFFMNLTSAIMSFIFGTIVSIYALIDKEKFKKMSKKITIATVGDTKAMQFFDFMATVNTVFSSFISGLLVDAMLVGILAFIGLSALGVEYALIFAIVICFTNIIPYIGPFIGAIPAVGITLLYDPMKALWVMIMIIILQQIDANIIGPRVMGNYIGLDAIWIILAIALGGAFAGMLGMILSIPIAAIIKILVGGVLTDYYQRQHSKIKL
jgi:predicted PurR-regulated permease PerM